MFPLPIWFGRLKELLVKIGVHPLCALHLPAKPHQSRQDDGKSDGLQCKPYFRKTFRLVDTLSIAMNNGHERKNTAYHKIEWLEFTNIFWTTLTEDNLQVDQIVRILQGGQFQESQRFAWICVGCILNDDRNRSARKTPWRTNRQTLFSMPWW